jgi:hypothetical protein
MAKALAPPTATKPLYEEDFPLWAERQAALLRAARFKELDLDNLIEEVEDLSRRERDTVESHVETIMEHLVELTLSPAERPRRGRLVTLDKQRAELARKLTATLRTHLEAELPALYEGLRRPVARQLERGAAVGKGRRAAECLASSLPLHARPASRSGLVPGQCVRTLGSAAVTVPCS